MLYFGKRCLLPDTSLLLCSTLNTNKTVHRISCIFTCLISLKPFKFVSGENMPVVVSDKIKVLRIPKTGH